MIGVGSDKNCLLQKRLWVFVFVTSVVDMAREGDVLSNLDSEVLRLRVEVGSALHSIKIN